LVGNYYFQTRLQGLNGRLGLRGYYDNDNDNDIDNDIDNDNNNDNDNDHGQVELKALF
jgi:hypothetical protein